MGGWVRALIVWAAVFLVVPAGARSAGTAGGGKGPPWDALISRLIQDGEDPAYVRGLFARPDIHFDPRVMPRKLTHQESKLDYGRFLESERLKRAHAYLDVHRAVLSRIEAHYAVPKEVKVAILLVETDLGRYLGSGAALNILASMAVAADFDGVRRWLPPELLAPSEVDQVRRRTVEKAGWAYDELKALLRYARENGRDPLDIKGSIFGAIGLCQFMPSNALRFGVDGDGDGKVDLFAECDALASMANYLRHYGWRPGLSQEEQESVLLRYNYSRPYAKTVVAVAERLRQMDRDGSR